VSVLVSSIVLLSFPARGGDGVTMTTRLRDGRGSHESGSAWAWRLRGSAREALLAVAEVEVWPRERRRGHLGHRELDTRARLAAANGYNASSPPCHPRKAVGESLTALRAHLDYRSLREHSDRSCADCCSMGNRHADPPTFRQSLLALLKERRWRVISGESPRELAKRLGVTVEVLEQANRELAADREQQGALPRQIGQRAHHRGDYAIAGVTMPDRVYRDWKALCAAKKMKPATVLRGLIHLFLLTGARPRTTGGTWLYRGELFTIKPTDRESAKTRVPPAAKAALNQYADLWRVDVTGIVRGIITDMLEARALPVGFRPQSVAALASNAAKYLETATSRKRR